jgi:hypothetical protein
MKLAIYTQIRENYGAHDWDGKGQCPQYWKMKGGQVFVVNNITVEQALKIKESGIPTLKSLIESFSESFEEYILDWSILDDDAVVCEEWDSPTILSWKNGRWVGSRVQKNDGQFRSEVAEKIEDYELLKGGNRNNYRICYTLTSTGEIVTDKEFFKVIGG